MATILHEWYVRGQSVWTNDLSRPLVTQGQLEDMIKQGVRGVHSDLTSFLAAMRLPPCLGHFRDRCQQGILLADVYNEMLIDTVRTAADLLAPLYAVTKGADGYITCDANPHHAHMVPLQVGEVSNLFKQMRRPNIIFNIPATHAGLSAVEELLSYGISVNLTLVTTPSEYSKAFDACVRGIKRYMQQGGLAWTVGAMVTVDLARLDAWCDRLIDERLRTCEDPELCQLKGAIGLFVAQHICRMRADIENTDSGKEIRLAQGHIPSVIWNMGHAASYGSSRIASMMCPHTMMAIPVELIEQVLNKNDDESTDAAATNDVDAPDRFQDVCRVLQRHALDINAIGNDILEQSIATHCASYDSFLAAIGTPGAPN